MSVYLRNVYCVTVKGYHIHRQTKVEMSFILVLEGQDPKKVMEKWYDFSGLKNVKYSINRVTQESVWHIGTQEDTNVSDKMKEILQKEAKKVRDLIHDA